MVSFSKAKNAYSTLIFAHGAGAPMDSPFMEVMTQHLLALGVNVARFEFPYMAQRRQDGVRRPPNRMNVLQEHWRSEEHTSELQSRPHLVCRLLLEKKNKEV